MSTRRSENVAAVLVLYHPADSVTANIAASAAQVGRLFAVDNTEEPDPAFVARLRDIPGVEYVPLAANLGIAAALNIGVRHVEAAGCPFALTLDQDSTPARDMVARLLECAGTCGTDFGLAVPVHQVEHAPEPARYDGCRPVLTAITSGDLLSVAAWEAIGGFDETLFIDQVDHDFCLRLHDAGFKVLECGRASMLHRMGDMEERRLLGPVYVSHHSATRRYYITRNRLEMIRRYRDRYPEFAKAERRAAFHELLKMLLLERDRPAKLRMVLRGWRDYHDGVSGPYRADRG